MLYEKRIQMNIPPIFAFPKQPQVRPSDCAAMYGQETVVRGGAIGRTNRLSAHRSINFGSTFRP